MKTTNVFPIAADPHTADLRERSERLDAVQLPLDPVLLELSEEEVAQLRAEILNHVQALELPSWAGENGPDALSKMRIRAMHAGQRSEVVARETASLGPKWARLLEHFADGSEVRPQQIDPELVPVKTEELSGDLYRMAALLWSVPISKGYGRRMRYLVRDRSNGKLIGIFGLTDPVFNLRRRDEWIGWNVEQRRAGLVHVMDAFAVGAVPPYSLILGGKLVTSLIASAEVGEAFSRRYSETQGIISKKHKAARLVLVTVTSALGRSSLYNRLRLKASLPFGHERVLVELIRVGETEGYGHFHLSEPLFRRLRQLVQSKRHAYANAHSYGEGPNWRIRLSRVGLGMLGLDEELLRHGISREIYVMPLASNCREFLCGEAEDAHVDRPTAKEIGAAALKRWVLPRAGRVADYRGFARNDLLEALR